MNVRMNYKNGQEKHKCRFWNEAEETQEHVIQDCQKMKRISDTIKYAEIFKENNMEKTRAIARALIQIINKLDETQYNQIQKHRLPLRWATWLNQAYATYIYIYIYMYIYIWMIN